MNIHSIIFIIFFIFFIFLYILRIKFILDKKSSNIFTQFICISPFILLVIFNIIDFFIRCSKGNINTFIFDIFLLPIIYAILIFIGELIIIINLKKNSKKL